MSDMTQVIVPKSDQINADSLLGGDMVITITGVEVRASQEQPVSIKFEGSPLVYRPCKSMARVLVALWGPDSSAYVGRSLKLYCDPTVKWGGMEVGGIRISEASHMEGNRPITMALTATKGARKPYTVKPLVMAEKVDPAPILANARAAAGKGTPAFTAWWNSDEGKAHRELVRPIMAEIKETCAKADAPPETDENADPFGLPPVDDDKPTLTPEQEADIRAQTERDWNAAQEAAE